MARKTTPPDVLIVGAGPTGLVLAIELARRNIPFRLIEKDLKQSDKSRALAIQARTLEIFYDMGLDGDFLKQVNNISRLNGFIEGKNAFSLGFENADTVYRSVAILHQTKTEKILEKRLNDLGGKIERGMALVGMTQSKNHVRVGVRSQKGAKETLNVPYVVGCDGAHSTVRTLLKLPFEGSDYEEGFMLADVSIDWPLIKNEGFVFMESQGILAALPLELSENPPFRLITTRNYFSKEVPQEGHKKRKKPTLEDFQKQVDALLPVAATLENPTWMANFRLHRKIVPKMQEGRVFLAGDAAHVHSPVGGQGMNTGIQDSYNLGWKLAMVLQKRLHESALESYNQERYPVAKKVLFGTNLAMRLIFTESALLQTVRNALAPKLFDSKSFQKKLANTIAEISVRYGRSTLINPFQGYRGFFSGGPKPGMRALNFSVQDPKTYKFSPLFKIFKGEKYTLIILPARQKERVLDFYRLGRRVQDLYQEVLNVHLVVRDDIVGTHNLDGSLENVWLDYAGFMHTIYKASVPAFYLVRPDGHVAFRSLPASGPRLYAYLKKLFV